MDEFDELVPVHAVAALVVLLHELLRLLPLQGRDAEDVGDALQVIGEQRPRVICVEQRERVVHHVLEVVTGGRAAQLRHDLVKDLLDLVDRGAELLQGGLNLRAEGRQPLLNLAEGGLHLRDEVLDHGAQVFQQVVRGLPQGVHDLGLEGFSLRVGGDRAVVQPLLQGSVGRVARRGENGVRALLDRGRDLDRLRQVRGNAVHLRLQVLRQGSSQARADAGPTVRRRPHAMQHSRRGEVPHEDHGVRDQRARDEEDHAPWHLPPIRHGGGDRSNGGI
mmetsp:Transcript_122591/g.354309  ORF Transcript_122591/g.354309 Transcript_122591/m.354309 type:complete len:277 (-) Transcript_122591:59-889(-)